MNFLLNLALTLGLALVGGAVVWGLLRFLFAAMDSRRMAAAGFAAALLTFAAVGVAIRLQDRTETPPPSELTYGDIVRPDLEGPLPTSTDIESWKAALTAFDLQWPDTNALETGPPANTLTFDDDFDGYIAGESDQEGTHLAAFMGFQDGGRAWFTCYASGLQTTATDDFLQTCWTAAAVTGADLEAGSTWIESAVAIDDSEPLIVEVEPVCPAALMVTDLSSTSSYINMQLTIAAGRNC